MQNAIRNNPNKRNIINLIFLVSALSLVFMGCRRDDNPIDPDNKDKDKDKDTYELYAKYSYIRSYPEGGGIFIVYITTGSGFSGSVKLRIEADPALNASLSKTTLDNASRVADIIIRPDANAAIKKYTVAVRAEHAGKVRTLPLEVELYNWENSPVETPLLKRNEFKNWLISRNNKYQSIFGVPDKLFHTYPEILIVEHYTYITEEYEVRFCYHVMIPPHDWSMILIRRRGAIDAELAARRESDGTINQIQVSDYPILLGY